ncbi:branched-chain amino acid ABC transporter substrate-binding protein [Betaproteobacteria bacterium]|nr:branched-chain amino acid ABC transporter substrate-binding protein [Betaproteobacteria bacterium]
MKKFCSALTCAAALVLNVASSNVCAQVKIGVVNSSTGPGSMIGIPQKNTIALLPTRIGDLGIEYILLDDASDPTAAVTATKKLINEQHIDAMIATTTAPNSVAMIPFIADAGVPMVAPVGTIAVIQPMTEQKRWVFKTTQNDAVVAETLIAHMAKTGVKTLGLIGTGDPYGENWSTVVSELSKKYGIKLVANEKFQRSDTSVTGQVLKILTTRPDAVLVAAPGGPAVLPQATLVDKGYKGKLYQTHGAALDAFLKLGGKKVEGTILAASLLLVLDDMPDSNPSKKITQDYVTAYEAKFGVKPPTFGAQVYDAGLLLNEAIPLATKKAQPGTREFRAALRDALESTKALVASQGTYTMSPTDHCGFDQKGGNELITVKDGKWALLKD